MTFWWICDLKLIFFIFFILQTVDEMGDTQSPDELIPVQDTISGNSIHMERSNIEYVIIGDHNSMTVSECLNSEVEEDTETEPDVIG